jgi:cell division protein ZapA
MVGKMNEKKKLKVKIFDREYSLLVENQEIAVELAEYVNSIMEETRDELPDQPKDTIAIIAALNIAYDLFVEKNRFREFSIQATDKVKKIKLLLSESNLTSNQT